MKTNFQDILKNHEALLKRRRNSTDSIKKVIEKVNGSMALTDDEIVIFAVGSLARGEVSLFSDLDVFLTTNNQEYARSRIHNFEVIAELIRINRELDFPQFSNDGQYLRIYSVTELMDQIGASIDDSENYFTARMLMLLEAQPINNDDEFRSQQKQLVTNYFRDGKGVDDFKPLFLVNDLLRYWRTLCLNYEETRHDSSRKWRKKNINLKFSRKITVFSTVLALISSNKEVYEPEGILWTLTPLERLAYALDGINDGDLLKRWPSFLDAYEEFLEWKETERIEEQLVNLNQQINNRDEEVSIFLHDALHHKSIQPDFRRFLTL